MTAWVDGAALVTAAAGVVVWAASAPLPRGGAWQGARAALALWTAAGLLRLATTPSWDRVAAAAAIVVVRHVVQLGFGSGRRPA